MNKEEKAKAYDEVLNKLRRFMAQGVDPLITRADVQDFFPELKESEDERIRKELLEFLDELSKLGKNTNFDKWSKSDCADWICWLEKQGESSIKWSKNTEGNKPQINHSVLMKTIHGIAEGEWKGGDNWIQYRWSSSIKDSDVLSWMELSDLDKQDGHKHAKLSEENDIDEKYKIGKWFTGLIPCWINAPSTLQPEHSNHGKNVVAIHLKGGGYRCCCIDDKKPRVFDVAENTPFEEGWHNRESSAWSEEDKNFMYDTLSNLTELKDIYGEGYGNVGKCIDWLISLKRRIGG